MNLLQMWNIFSVAGKIEDVILKKTKNKMYGIVTFINGLDSIRKTWPQSAKNACMNAK